MTTVLPGGSNLDLIGQLIGQGLSSTLPQATQQGFNRAQLQQSLDAIKDLASKPGSKPLDIMLSAMKAGAGIPGSERYLGAIIPELAKFATAGAEKNIPQPGEGPFTVPQRQAAPEFLRQPGQPSKFFPSNVGPQEAPGNVPQAATTGIIEPLKSPKEKIAAARQLHDDSHAAGIPITMPQAMAQVEANEADKRAHNQMVEDERKQRVGAQEEYGQKAVDRLIEVHPNATPEQKAIFKKKGEEIATQGKSEADIERYLAKEATKFKNTLANIRNDISAPRFYNRISRKFAGTDKDFNEAAADMRVKLKPLLDEGLYDTARKLLSDQGYYPEERETIINPMSERQKTLMNRVPDIKAKFEVPLGIAGTLEQRMLPQHIENIKSGLRDLKQADPNFSLVLARKAFEDRGYTWRAFKDALNALEQEGFKLEDDQENQRSVLDTPPLTELEKRLESLSLIGR